eukprot:TRINITY_DN2781_c0_g3_i1.p1 TRINITY_DN2781_c0_g3~~TRINITY_DN2781_c0_g3_i1.p1  ORF type:complete len:161 (-),score=12.77 TRINITY_DN2781_c0_g3_i1:9-491(-)
MHMSTSFPLNMNRADANKVNVLRKVEITPFPLLDKSQPIPDFLKATAIEIAMKGQLEIHCSACFNTAGLKLRVAFILNELEPCGKPHGSNTFKTDKEQHLLCSAAVWFTSVVEVIVLDTMTFRIEHSFCETEDSFPRRLISLPSSCNYLLFTPLVDILKH